MTTIIIPTTPILINKKRTGHPARLIQRMIQFALIETKTDYLDGTVEWGYKYEGNQDIFVQFKLNQEKLSLEGFQQKIAAINLDQLIDQYNFFVNNERELIKDDYILHNKINNILYGKLYGGIRPLKQNHLKLVKQYFRTYFLNFEKWIIDENVDILKQSSYMKEINSIDQIIHLKDQGIEYLVICISTSQGRKSYIKSFILKQLFWSWVTYNNRYLLKNMYSAGNFIQFLHSNHWSISFEANHCQLINSISTEFIHKFIEKIVNIEWLESETDETYLNVTQYMSSDLIKIDPEEILDYIITYDWHNFLIQTLKNETLY